MQMGVDAAGDEANQPCEISGKWPLTTSPMGPRVADRGLEVPAIEKDSILKVS